MRPLPIWVSIALHKEFLYLFVADSLFLFRLQICRALLQTSDLHHTGLTKQGQQGRHSQPRLLTCNSRPALHPLGREKGPL